MSSATVTPSSDADRPARLAGALHEHLVCAEVVAEHPEAAALELLELAGRESGTDGAELLAELGAEHRQVRLHVQFGRVDVTELDLFHAQLLAKLVHMPPRERGALDDETPERLAQLEAGRSAGLVAARDDTANLSDLREQVFVGQRRFRPAREVDGERRVPGRIAYERVATGAR